MGRRPDSLILSPNEVQKLRTPEEAVNFVDAEINAVLELLRVRPPPPTDQLSALEYMLWERRVMIIYGGAVKALDALHAFGHIPRPMFERLKRKAMGTMLPKVANVQMGTDPYGTRQKS